MSNSQKNRERVELRTETLGNLLGLSKHEAGQKNSNDTTSYKLAIPDYQRIYCWDEKQVIQLLEDIKSLTDRTYHLGNIILHKKEADDSFDIVDGQQRLVTLVLLLLELNQEIETSLLNERFDSSEAQNYLAYNKWLINNYVDKNDLKNNSKGYFDRILKWLSFSVLVINDGHLDLAYTFFSNQNSRGKALSDYDLLKAHHLRYIQVQDQARHLAGRWDAIVTMSDSIEGQNNGEREQLRFRTFEICLFRLRKWMRKREWSNDEKFKVKTEFESAPIINEIPPFGEKFHFYESIQGGSHFFGYSEYFIHRYQQFSITKEFKVLYDNLSSERHWWYRDVIESLLFAYYLKFGTIYLAEAMDVIIRRISDHRYQNSRVYLKSVFSYINNSEIVMMIDQATSPTFFLAEINNAIKRLPKKPDLNGTRKRFDDSVSKIRNETVGKSLEILTFISEN